jgi:hypothetical protein
MSVPGKSLRSGFFQLTSFGSRWHPVRMKQGSRRTARRPSKLSDEADAGILPLIVCWSSPTNLAAAGTDAAPCSTALASPALSSASFTHGFAIAALLEEA